MISAELDYGRDFLYRNNNNRTASLIMLLEVIRRISINSRAAR
jgi:hypothetical protein